MCNFDENGIIHLPQNQFFASEVLARISEQPLKEISIVTHVGLMSMACQSCPFQKTLLGCNQCNQWIKQES